MFLNVVPRNILMFHNRGEHQRRSEWNRERISYGFVMLFFRTVFEYIQSQALVNILEKIFVSSPSVMIIVFCVLRSLKLANVGPNIGCVDTNGVSGLGVKFR